MSNEPLLLHHGWSGVVFPGMARVFANPRGRDLLWVCPRVLFCALFLLVAWAGIYRFCLFLRMTAFFCFYWFILLLVHHLSGLCSGVLCSVNGEVFHWGKVKYLHFVPIVLCVNAVEKAEKLLNSERWCRDGFYYVKIVVELLVPQLRKAYEALAVLNLMGFPLLGYWGVYTQGVWECYLVGYFFVNAGDWRPWLVQWKYYA